MFSDPQQVIRHLALEPGMAVADFGSGSGAYSLGLAEQVSDRGKVYAIDVQKNLLERLEQEARSRGRGNLRIIWGNVEKVGGSKLADGAVDLVLIANTLFQSSARYLMFAEARRVLRPGGRLAVVEWSGSFGGLGPAAEAILKPEEVKAIAAEAGFSFSREFPAGEHHYGLMFNQV